MSEEQCVLCDEIVDTDLQGINCERCGQFVCMDCQDHSGPQSLCDDCGMDDYTERALAENEKDLR